MQGKRTSEDTPALYPAVVKKRRVASSTAEGNREGDGQQNEGAILILNDEIDRDNDSTSDLIISNRTFDLLPDEIALQVFQKTAEYCWPICRYVCRFWRILLTDMIGEDGTTSDEQAWLCDLAKEGYLSCLQWAKRAGYPVKHVDVIASAAEGGHVTLLRWLRTIGCPWDSLTCAKAAEGGHLEALQWAREHGCIWNECTCVCAAQAGHLEVLRWARENGCPWDLQTSAAAAEAGHVEVLEWAVDNGCPWDELTVYQLAGKGGHWEVQLWVRERTQLYIAPNVLNEWTEA